MNAVELRVVVYSPKHTNLELASAVRTLMVWAENEAPYISVFDPNDESVALFAERDLE